jgi:hypothetical protein
MSQTRAGWRGRQGLVNELSDKAEKKDAMGEIHRLHTKMAAFNSQMSQAKGWGLSREKGFESKGFNKEGQKSG